MGGIFLKKYIYLMVILISICFFTISFDAFNQKLSIDYGSNYMPVQENHSILTFSFSCGDQDRDIEEVIRVLYDYTKEYKLDFTLGGNENILGRNYSYRWAQFHSGILPFDSRYVKEGTAETLRYGSDIYYRSDLQDPHALHLRYLDKNYYDDIQHSVLLYLPFHLKSEVWRTMSSGMIFISVLEEDVTFHQNQLSHLFEDVVDHISLFEIIDEYESIPHNDDRLLNVLMVLSVVFFGIMMLLYLLRQQREIMIRKLHGNHDLLIYHRLFTKMICTISLIPFVVFGVMFFYRTQEYSTLALTFMIDLFKIVPVFFVCLHMICGLFYVIVRKNVSLRTMNYVPMHIIYYGGGIVRMILIIICISQFAISFPYLKNNIDTVNRYHQQEKILQNKWTLNRLGNMHSSHFQTECIEAYHRLSDEGALYCTTTALENGCNEIGVNEAFVKTFLPKELWENLSFKNRNIVWKPKTKQNQMSELLLAESEADIVEYQQDLEVPILDFYRLDIPSVLHNPVIVMIKDPTKMRYSLTIQGMELMIPVQDNKIAHHEIYEKISDLSIAEGMSVESVDVFSKQQLDGCMKSIFRTVVQFILYATVLIAFAYLNLKIFYFQYGKEVMIRYLHGNSFWRRYRVVFVAEVIVHVVAMCASILNGNQYQHLWWIMMIFMMTIGVYCVIIRLYEKHRLLSVLKGGTT